MLTAHVCCETQLLLIAKASDLEAKAKLFQAYRSAALENKGKVVFVTVNLDGSHHEPVTKFFGVDVSRASALLRYFVQMYE